MADPRTLRHFEPKIGRRPAESTHASLWRRLHVVRLREPMRATDAVATWRAYAGTHDGDVEAALGELVAAFIDGEARR